MLGLLVYFALALVLIVGLLVWSVSAVSGGSGTPHQFDQRLSGGSRGASGVVLIGPLAVHIECLMRPLPPGRGVGVGRPGGVAQKVLSEMKPLLDSGWRSITVARLKVPVWAELSDRDGFATTPGSAGPSSAGARFSFRWGGSTILVWWKGAVLLLLAAGALGVMTQCTVAASPYIAEQVRHGFRYHNSKFLTTRECLLNWVIVAFMATSGLQMFFINRAGASRSVVLAGFIGCLLCGAGLVSLTTVVHRRNERRIREARAMFCASCRYAVGGLADAGLCPECGAPYRSAMLRDHWRRWYRKAVPGD